MSNKKTELFFEYSSKAIFKTNWKLYRDSVDFLNNCPREVDPDMEIVTFDVTGLYTNTLQEYGLKALGYFLTIWVFKEEMNPRLNNQFILDATEFFLKSNSLIFYSVFFFILKGQQWAQS